MTRRPRGRHGELLTGGSRAAIERHDLRSPDSVGDVVRREADVGKGTHTSFPKKETQPQRASQESRGRAVGPEEAAPPQRWSARLMAEVDQAASFSSEGLSGMGIFPSGERSLPESRNHQGDLDALTA